ncbi:MAG: ferredoxin III, nif-specific [Alphaproteobacteria bacterium]|nr:ferredoxin III, nif-specific [Alphaproteobacteria bacterium]MBF0249402.1 ferredoxin III, nif-specific [Alphaproteobacteria bacterium]
MSTIIGITRSGKEYVPEFIETLDQTKCIGCGRCFKTCPRDVFDLVDRDDLDLGDFDDDDWSDDGFSDDAAMVMSLKDPMDCIGCQACFKVCPKACMTHAPQPAP